MMLKREPFYFLRHGQTDWNSEGLVQGQTNVSLNVMGKNQANGAKVRLMDTPVTTICCSPLDRAWQTAKIINEALSCQRVIIDELQECNFGEAEGKRLFGDSYDELNRRAERYCEEPFEVFVDRVIARVNQVLYQNPLISTRGPSFETPPAAAPQGRRAVSKPHPEEA